MIETLTVITLAVLYIVFFRPGRTPPLKNSLVIERIGQFHMTLAPQLNLAQPFIEAIAGQVRPQIGESKDSTTQCFEVCDKQVSAHGHDCYLMAMTLREGILYFQAVSPKSNDQHGLLDTIIDFADGVLSRIPIRGKPNRALDELLIAAVQKAAKIDDVRIKILAS